MLTCLLVDPQALSRAYAEHLVEQQQAEQAGLLLWRSGELAAALQAFTASSSWRNAVCVAQQIPLPPDQLALLARDLAGNQQHQHDHEHEHKHDHDREHDHEHQDLAHRLKESELFCQTFTQSLFLFLFLQRN